MLNLQLFGKSTENIPVTSLKPESYNDWRLNNKKSPKSRGSIKENNFVKEKQKKSETASYNFKLAHSSSEYQDGYLKGRLKRASVESSTFQARFASLKNESNGAFSEADNKQFIEKLEKKANNFNPEINLYNIMKAVTKELDHDEEARNLKDKIRPPNKLELLQRIKTQSLHTIQETIKQSEVEKMKSMTKTEIARISNEMTYLLDKAVRENQTMQNSLEDSKKESEELKMENDKLIRRNQVLTQNLKEISGKNEKLLQDIQKLESFKYSYNFFTEKFPNCSIEKFIDKFIYLENSCMALTKRICDLEDDKRIIDQEKNNIEKKIEQIHYQMDLKEMESERILMKFKMENQDAETAIKDNEKFKESYLQLSNKILNIFSKWTDKVKIYYDYKNHIPPQANVSDPIEMLDVLDKIITISTPEKLQIYLRKIIVIANVLQRKYFQENVNEKFDPDKIYARIIGKIDKMENEKTSLLSELNHYRKVCISPSIKKRATSAAQKSETVGKLKDFETNKK